VNKLTSLFLTLILACFVVATSQAATDYNSSRSNKSEDSGVAADALNDLLNKATADAKRMGKKIISIEADGDENAEILLKVTVKVQACKITKECQANPENETKLECKCTHL
jgi:hypothetical protein